MQSLKYLTLVMVAAVVFSVGAFAKDFHSASFDLAQTTTIGSTVLQPGHYKVEWNGPNDALQISIVEDGKTVATTQGSIKELSSKAPYSAVIIRNDNSKKLEEIDFANHTDALVFAGL